MPRIKRLQLSRLNPAAYNPREITEAAMAGLTHSLKRFGLVEPIVVNVRGGANVIVGGHQRVRALMEMFGAKHMAACVAVDLSPEDEKLLNLALNNPNIQGDFIDDLPGYIARLKAELTDDSDLLDLRIVELRGELGATASEPLNYREVELKPFKKCHILLSFPPQLIGRVDAAISELLKTPGVEHEQGAN